MPHELVTTLGGAGGRRARATRRWLGFFAGLLAILAAPQALAKSVGFVESILSGPSGSAVGFTVVTRDDMDIPIGGGTLTFTLGSGISCSYVSFPVPPPAVPDGSGSTGGQIIATQADYCDMQVEWDPDGPGTEPPVSASVSIDIFGNYSTQPVAAPSGVLTPFSPSPSFTARLLDSLSPVAGADVGWHLIKPDQSELFFGGDCTFEYSTDGNGETSFDFATALQSLDQIGAYTLEASFSTYCSQALRGAAAKRSKGLPYETFNFSVEAVQISFQSPPLEVQVGTSADFPVRVSSTPSDAPVAGVNIDWIASNSATTSPTSGMVVSDSSGMATIQVSAIGTSISPSDLTASFNETIGAGNFSDSDVASFLPQSFALELTTPATATPTFTDETVAGYTVRTAVDSGNGATGEDGHDVTFSITSGNAVFEPSGLTSAMVTSSGGGFAQAPTIRVGRTGSVVVVHADGGSFGSLDQNYNVQASTYSLTANNTASPQGISEGGSAPLSVVLTRTGSSAPVPLGPGESISYSISPDDGSTISPAPATTDGNGIANVVFTPAGTGSYTVTANFLTGLGGASDPSLPFVVDVTPLVRSLAKVDGDGQSALPNTGFPIALKVLAQDDAGAGAGAPLAPVTIDWSVQSGSASLGGAGATNSSSTDGNGYAVMAVDAGASPGPVSIRATRSDNTSKFVEFTLDVLGPALQIAVTGPAQVSAPGDISYTITLSNTGDADLTGISVVNTLPGGSPQPLPAPDGGDAADPGVLNTGESWTYTRSYTVSQADLDAGGTLVDSAEASSEQLPTPSPAMWSTTVQQTPQLSALKTAVITGDANGNGSGEAGDVITYTVKLSNGGNVTLLNLEVEDSLAGAAPTLLAGCPSSLAPQSSADCASYTHEVTSAEANAGGTLSNTATAHGMLPNESTISSAPSTASVRVGQSIFRTLIKPASNSGDRQSGPVGSTLAIPLRVIARDNGDPVEGVGIRWSTSSTAVLAATRTTTDSSGQSSVGVTLPDSAGQLTIVATREDEPSASTSFVLTATASGLRLSKVSGDGQTGLPGSEGANLVVELLDGSTPVVGAEVQWSVQSGDALLASNATSTQADGRAAVGLRFGPSAGSSLINASSSGFSVQFRVDAIATGDSLIAVSGDQQTALIQTRADRAMEVRLLDGNGQPRSGQRIQWKLTSGSAVLDADASDTDDNGNARIGFRFGDSAGPVVVEASSGRVLLPVVFHHEAVNPNASALGGDGQTGAPGELLPLPLQLQVGLPTTKGLDGVQVSWTVLTGGGQLAAASTASNAQGVVSNQWTLGAQLGAQTVRAELPDGQQFVFSATAVNAADTLVIVSGDGQSLPTNEDSAPLVVRLDDSEGHPVAGYAIRWSGSNAAVSADVSVTGSDGRAQVTAKVLVPGAASVSASVDGNAALAVTFNLNGGVAEIPGLSPVQESTGTAIDTLCPTLAALPTRTAEEEDLFQRCSEFVVNAGDNPGEVRNALDEIPTDVGATLAGSGLDSVGTQFDNVDLRLHLVRSQQSSGRRNQFNLALWTPDGSLPLSFLPSVLAASAGEDEQAEEVGADFSRWGFFATGQIGRGEYKGGSRTPKFDFDIAGITAGVDYRFSDRWIGGVAAGYTNNDAELPGGEGTLDTTGWSLTGYATWYNERAWYVDGSLLYGRNTYDLQRRIAYSITALDGGRTTVDQIARASTDGNNFGGTVSVGRDWQKGPWSLNGYLRAAYQRVETDAYAERMLEGLPGQGLALAIDARTSTSTTSALGGRATYVLSRDWGILMPNASIEWEHEFQDDPNRVVARFLHDPTRTPIVRVGDPIDSNYFNLGLGVSALFPGGKSAFLYYEELVGASKLRQGILSLGARFEF